MVANPETVLPYPMRQPWSRTPDPADSIGPIGRAVRGSGSLEIGRHDGPVARKLAAKARGRRALTVVYPPRSKSPLTTSLLLAGRRPKARVGGRALLTAISAALGHGYPLDCTALTKRFQALLERVGLPRLRLHDLRHSSASLLLSQHIPARVVMERLGHSTIALTMNTYSHVIAELNQEAADAIDRVLGA